MAHAAHVSGTVFGATLSIALLATGLLPRDQFDVWSLLMRWNRRRQFKDMVSQGYNPFGYTPEPGPVDPRPQTVDPRSSRLLDLRAEISEAIAHHNLPHAAYLFLELKKLDPNQVLSRQAQLDVANQLASQQFYAQAAEAYEQFLSHYPNFDQIEQVELMLGVIYARYLQHYERHGSFCCGAGATAWGAANFVGAGGTGADRAADRVATYAAGLNFDMVSLAKRRREAEWMDDPGADPAVLRSSLRFIRRINFWLGYTRATVGHLKQFSRRWKKGETIRIVDLATGSADVPRAILNWAKKRGGMCELWEWIGTPPRRTRLAATRRTCRSCRGTC